MWEHLVINPTIILIDGSYENNDLNFFPNYNIELNNFFMFIFVSGRGSRIWGEKDDQIWVILLVRRKTVFLKFIWMSNLVYNKYGNRSKEGPISATMKHLKFKVEDVRNWK